MGISDEEIDRAVSGMTPTATAAPAPAVLQEMKAAMRREHRQHRRERLVQWARAGSVPAAYIALALALAGLVIQLRS